MIKSIFLLALSFLLIACSPRASASPISPPAKLTVVASTSLPPTHMIIRSSSLSLVVDDPAEALSAIEQAVEDAGGFVASASYYSSPEYGDSASLSAKVPPESLSDLRRATLKLATEVQSDSVYSQDVTSEYQLLNDKLNDLNKTEAHLWELVTQTEDAELAKSLTLLRDLVQREISSVESQLLNYENSSAVASFDVTINQILKTQIILE